MCNNVSFIRLNHITSHTYQKRMFNEFINIINIDTFFHINKNMKLKALNFNSSVEIKLWNFFKPELVARTFYTILNMFLYKKHQTMRTFYIFSQ